MAERTPNDIPDVPDEGTGYSLVMPFVTVASKGGPYDDDAYVAGYEMGQLDAALALRPEEHAATVRTENAIQADLIAMRHGYTRTTEVYAPSPEWSIVSFTPGPARCTGGL